VVGIAGFAALWVLGRGRGLVTGASGPFHAGLCSRCVTGKVLSGMLRPAQLSSTRPLLLASSRSVFCTLSSALISVAFRRGLVFLSVRCFPILRGPETVWR
jgi:hypothetical protein